MSQTTVNAPGLTVYSPSTHEFLPFEKKSIKLGFSLQIPDGCVVESKNHNSILEIGLEVTSKLMTAGNL